MFLMTAFVIRDRYLAYDIKGRKGENQSGFPLLTFMSISYFLAFLMVVLSASSVGLAQAINSPNNLSFTEIDAEFKASNNLLYAFIAFYLVATIFLIPMAIMARKKTGSDTIINMTLFAVIPLLLARAISRMILVIVAAPSTVITSFNPAAFDFADTFVEGIPYFVAISILCYFFLFIQLWDVPGESGFQPYGSNGYQGNQQQPQPVAKSLGQWGYPGMPPQQQQQGYTNMPYPLPQQGAGGYYPNQQPGQQQYAQLQQQQSQSPVSPGYSMVGGSPVVVESFHESATHAPAGRA